MSSISIFYSDLGFILGSHLKANLNEQNKMFQFITCCSEVQLVDFRGQANWIELEEYCQFQWLLQIDLITCYARLPKLVDFCTMGLSEWKISALMKNKLSGRKE